MFAKKLLPIIFLIGITLSVAFSSIIFAESQTDASEFGTVGDLIEECKQENDCEKIIKALVKAQANFEFYDLDSAELVGINLEDANLDNANLSNADLRIAHLKKVRLNNANLKGANLDSAYLGGVSLTNGNLTGANLGNAKLSGVDLTDANLEGAYLANAELNAGFSNANLRYANLSNTKFYRSILRDANLEFADLNSADMTRASFYNANFKGANLDRAILVITERHESDVARVNAQLKSACNWQRAIYKAYQEEGKWIVDEVANKQYLEQLKQDKASEPKEAVDCSRWSN